MIDRFHARAPDGRGAGTASHQVDQRLSRWLFPAAGGDRGGIYRIVLNVGRQRTGQHRAFYGENLADRLQRDLGDVQLGGVSAGTSGKTPRPFSMPRCAASVGNQLGMREHARDLANRARTGKLQPDDVKDGTFTVTNVGTFGNVMGTPIINQPQVAIMAVGVIKKKPAVIETPSGDLIGIRHFMFLSHSYDHRVVDGSLGGQFVRRVADYLEQWDVNREY